MEKDLEPSWFISSLAYASSVLRERMHWKKWDMSVFPMCHEPLCSLLPQGGSNRPPLSIIWIYAHKIRQITLPDSFTLTTPFLRGRGVRKIPQHFIPPFHQYLYVVFICSLSFAYTSTMKPFSGGKITNWEYDQAFWWGFKVNRIRAVHLFCLHRVQSFPKRNLVLLWMSATGR